MAVLLKCVLGTIMWTNLHVIVSVHHFLPSVNFGFLLAARNNTSMIIATAGFAKGRLHTESYPLVYFIEFAYK